MGFQGLGAGLAVMLVLAGGAAAQDFDGSLSSAERRAVAASGLPRNQVVSIKRDLVVAIQSRGTSKGGILFEGVQLRGEAVSADAARNLGYRSMRSTVNVDCARRRDMVVRMTIYPEANGKGEPILRQVPGGWIQPSPSAFMSDVIASICSDAPVAAALAPEPREKATPPKPRPVAAAKPPPPVHSPPVVPPPPPRPEVIGESEAIPTALTARRPRLALPPEELPGPPPPRAPAAAAPPPEVPAPPRAGNVRVQIVAVGTERQAREALAKLGPLPEPLRTSVEQATVGGRVFHRALVTGFANRFEAGVFCEVLAEYGGACFIR